MYKCKEGKQGVPTLACTLSPNRLTDFLTGSSSNVVLLSLQGGYRAKSHLGAYLRAVWHSVAVCVINLGVASRKQRKVLTRIAVLPSSVCCLALCPRFRHQSWSCFAQAAKNVNPPHGSVAQRGSRTSHTRLSDKPRLGQISVWCGTLSSFSSSILKQLCPGSKKC